MYNIQFFFTYVALSLHVCFSMTAFFLSFAVTSTLFHILSFLLNLRSCVTGKVTGYFFVDILEIALYTVYKHL